MEVMYNRLFRLYKDGEINEAMLETAVGKGWISVDGKNSIINTI